MADTATDPKTIPPAIFQKRAGGKKLCSKITEVNLSAFAYRLFHEDFSSILGAKCSEISTRFNYIQLTINMHSTTCDSRVPKQI